LHGRVKIARSPNRIFTVRRPRSGKALRWTLAAQKFCLQFGHPVMRESCDIPTE